MTEVIVPPEGEVVPPPPAPRLNSLIILGKDQSYDDLPKPKLPYYALSDEGIYLRKWATLGTGTIRLRALPENILGKLGNSVGYFSWEAPPVPAVLCAQIVDFFRRIWNKHKSEAEVLLTARIEMVEGRSTIREWRVFVPTQRVSSGGVESVFEPTHIAKDHLVVGTMHSHCNFSAFHSGVDEADARNMDGLHITIGFVDKETPQYAAMVAVNGMNVNYRGDELATVADFSDLSAGKAPEWWDQYVIPVSRLATTHKPVGYGYFDKYESSKPHTGYGGTYGSGYAEGSYGRYGMYPPAQNHWSNWDRPTNPVKDNNTKPPASVGTRKLGDIVAEHNKKLAKFNGKSQENSALLPMDVRSTDDRNIPTTELSDAEYVAFLKARGEEYWEDNLDSAFGDALLGANIITERDIVEFSTLGEKVNESYLRVLILNKMRESKEVLALLGIDMECVIKGINKERVKQVVVKPKTQVKVNHSSRKVSNGNNSKGSKQSVNRKH